MNLGDIPRRNAYRFADRPALITAEGECLTWAVLNRQINQAAHVLQSRGLQKGDRLAILSAPSADVVLAYFAAAKIGLVIVPIHTGLVEREVEFLLSDVGARAILIEADLVDTVRAAIASVTTIEHVIVLGHREGEPSLSGLMEDASPEEPSSQVDEHDLFAIRFTSGTTGRPKGCPSLHRDWLRRSMNFLAHVSHSHRDCALLVSPLSLGVGSSMLMSYSLVGASMVLKRRFDAAEVLRAIESHRVTTFMIPVPTLFGRLLESPEIADVDLGSLRVVGYGGAVFPIPLLRRTLERFRCDFFGVYGHLEAGGFSTYLLPDDHRLDDCDEAERAKRLRRLSSCGREAIQADVRVADDSGHILPPGEVGELIVRTEGMITDYWNRPGEIEKSIRNGWFHTGDAASIDEDRYVYISDRLKDVVRTGGMNVSSLEVEIAMLELAGVAEAAVIGIPDPRWGEIIMACIVREVGSELDEDAVLFHCRSTLANYKIPKRIEFVSELPKNSMGKTLKRDLKDRYAQQTQGVVK